MAADRPFAVRSLALALARALAGTVAVAGLGATPALGQGCGAHCRHGFVRGGSPADAGLPMPVQLCFPEGLPRAKQDELVRKFRFRAPSDLRNMRLLPRFFSFDEVWIGEAGLTPPGASEPAALTYSFPPDQTPWGNVDPAQLPELGDPVPNALSAHLVAEFGSLDAGREHIRQALARWTRWSGLSYSEVADDGAAISSSSTRDAARGDLRIGGGAYGRPGFLAFNYFPSFGGDMTINTSYFNGEGDTFEDDYRNHRYFRSMVTHENGHGIGFFHPVPCTGTKVMEPVVNPFYERMQTDDLRGAVFFYGDRLAGNHAQADAADLGLVAGPGGREVRLRRLGLNTLTESESDYFTVSSAVADTLVIRVEPEQGAYRNDQQDVGCLNYNPLDDPLNSGFEGWTIVEPRLAADIRIEALDGGGAVVASGAQPVAGEAVELQVPVSAGATLAFRVVGDQTAVSEENQWVSLYDLLIEPLSGAAEAPAPWAGAGLDKRVRVGEPVTFIGDLLSEPVAEGARLVSYEWDLDGDGSFETSGAQPELVYTSQGDVDVTLRVTDSNGATDTDTIRVTVVDDLAPTRALVANVSRITDTGVDLTRVTYEGDLDQTSNYIPQGETLDLRLVGEFPTSGVSLAEFGFIGVPGLSLSGTPVVSQGGGLMTGLRVTAATDASLAASAVVYTPSGGGAPAQSVNAPVTVAPGQPFARVVSITPQVIEAGTVTPVTIVADDLEGAFFFGSVLNSDAFRFEQSWIRVLGPNQLEDEDFALPAPDSNGRYVLDNLFVEVDADARPGPTIVQILTIGGTPTNPDGAFALQRTDGIVSVTNANPPAPTIAAIEPTVFPLGEVVPITLTGTGIAPDVDGLPLTTSIAYQTFTVEPAPTAEARFRVFGYPVTSPDGARVDGLFMTSEIDEAAGVFSFRYDGEGEDQIALLENAIEFVVGAPVCVADLTTDGSANGEPDGVVTLSDFSFYLSLWSSGDARADVTASGVCEPGTGGDGVTLSDFSCYLSLWSQGCP